MVLIMTHFFKGIEHFRKYAYLHFLPSLSYEELNQFHVCVLGM